MTFEDALKQLKALADPARASAKRAYHKIDRTYLGLDNGQIDDIAKGWRQNLDTEARVTLADALWQSNIYDARLAAAKLLTQARIRPDDTEAWSIIASWTKDFDSWSIADHACLAGQRRLMANPDRLDQVESWTQSDHMWTRRAALVITLPWTKQRDPKPAEIRARKRILDWAAGYVDDHEWFIQKAIGWWLRELSKRDPETTRSFIAQYGERMKPFAVKEALRRLPTET